MTSLGANGDLSAIKAILDSQVRGAPAKVGSLAPKDVIVPAGPTGMDPKQTGFFQALNIQTKIVKAQIEIINPVTVIILGDKVTPSQTALLDKLKIMPFEYKMNIRSFMEGGKLVDAMVLSITNDDVLATFGANAFKNLAGAAIAADYAFPQLAALKNAAASAPAAGASAAVVEAAPEPEEDVDMGDLF